MEDSNICSECIPMIPNMLAGAIHLEFEINRDNMMHDYVLPIAELGFMKVKTKQRKSDNKKV